MTLFALIVLCQCGVLERSQVRYFLILKCRDQYLRVFELLEGGYLCNRASFRKQTGDCTVRKKVSKGDAYDGSL